MRFVLNVEFHCFLGLQLRRVENNRSAAILRWLSGLVCTGGSDNGSDLSLRSCLSITARALNAPSQLELGAYLLWLAQKTSEKGARCVLLRRCVRKPQEMCAQFKLSAGIMIARAAISKARSGSASSSDPPVRACRARRPPQNGPRPIVLTTTAGVQRGPQKLTGPELFRSTAVFG